MGWDPVAPVFDPPVAIADGGTGAADALTALSNLGALNRCHSSLTFAAAASDTVEDRISFPFNSGIVQAIVVAPIGTAATAGTLAVTKGVASGGNTLLDAATFDLTTLSDNTLSVLTLTGTSADRQGGATTGLTIAFANSDAAHLITVIFGLA